MSDYLVHVTETDVHTLKGVSMVVNDTGILLAYADIELVAAYTKWDLFRELPKEVR
ncbi:MAG: hypothetical protein JKY50_22720 [Oleispira sp.]|nr:hypothetical protein [Oleispira sp.]